MIHKIALVCIKENKLLVVHKPKIGLYITPGGKIKESETHEECLQREIKEELGCSIDKMAFFRRFDGKTEDNQDICMDCYFGELKGEIKLSKNDSIKNYCWIDKKMAEQLPLGTMLTKNIIPELIAEKLIT